MTMMVNMSSRGFSITAAWPLFLPWTNFLPRTLLAATRSLGRLPGITMAMRLVQRRNGHVAKLLPHAGVDGVDQVVVGHGALGRRRDRRLVGQRRLERLELLVQPLAVEDLAAVDARHLGDLQESARHGERVALIGEQKTNVDGGVLLLLLLRRAAAGSDVERRDLRPYGGDEQEADAAREQVDERNQVHLCVERLLAALAGRLRRCSGHVVALPFPVRCAAATAAAGWPGSASCPCWTRSG